MIWSHTFLNDYENCPRKTHRKHVVRDLPYVETPAMRWGNVVHTATERRLTAGVPLPTECEHLEPICKAILGAGSVYGEQKVAVTAQWEPCSFYADNVAGRGKIDVLIMPNKWQAIILDWKTGKRREDPTELETHAALLYAREPQLQQIIGHYIWTTDNQLGEAHILSSVAKTKLRIVRMLEHIHKAEQTNFWPPRENPLCSWCDVTDCEFNKGKRQ